MTGWTFTNPETARLYRAARLHDRIMAGALVALLLTVVTFPFWMEYIV